jgi:hypothetical protein
MSNDEVMLNLANLRESYGLYPIKRFARHGDETNTESILLDSVFDDAEIGRADQRRWVASSHERETVRDALLQVMFSSKTSFITTHLNRSNYTASTSLVPTEGKEEREMCTMTRDGLQKFSL